MPTKQPTRKQSACAPGLRRRAGLLTAFLLAAQLSACSPNADSEATKKKLDQANAKIAALESELAGIKARTFPAVASVAAQSPVPAPGTAPSAPPAPVPKVGLVGLQWSYSVDEEQMTGGKRKTASVSSTNTVDFGFPYSGSQNGHLTLRTDPRYGKDVIFRIEKGQMLCTSYEGCAVQVRFDDDKPTSFSASAASDHSSELVFIDDYARFLAKMKKAKRVRMSIAVYQNGRPVFDFDVSGFDADKYQAKS